MQIAQPLAPRRPHCVKGPRAGVTDGTAPGTARPDDLAHGGKGHTGLEGTRRICGPASREGRTALIAS